jgi:hypothetical protein
MKTFKQVIRIFSSGTLIASNYMHGKSYQHFVIAEQKIVKALKLLRSFNGPLMLYCFTYGVIR